MPRACAARGARRAVDPFDPHLPIAMLALPLLGLMFTAALGAQSPLVTTFAHNIFSLPNGAVYFDLNVFAPAITVTRLDLNLVGSGAVEVYTRSDSRLGNITSPAGWTLAGIAFVSGATAGAQTPVQLSPFALTHGIHGVAIRGLGMQVLQTIGTGTNQTYTNPDVRLLAGEETPALFTPPAISPRVPNIAVHYLVGSLVDVPPHFLNQNGQSRGFRFTAATAFNIRQLALPAQAFQAGDSASYLVRVNGNVAYRSTGNLGPVDVDLHVLYGDVVDVIANWSAPAAGSNSAHVSTAAPATWQTTIDGVSHTLDAVGWSWDIGAPNWTPNGATGYFLPPGTTATFGRVLLTTEHNQLQATNTSIGAGCGTVTASCYESMVAPAFDLANSALTFTPRPAGGYVVSRTGQMLPVGATGPLQTLVMNDNSEITVPFTLGSFPGWTGVTICSNGFVSRAPGNGTSGVPIAPAMLGASQTAFWSWHDYNPSIPAGGRVKVEQNVGITVITWDGVWDAGGTGPQSANTMQFQLYGNGTATIAWGTMSGAGGDHLVGYSPGGQSPSIPETDLSALTSSPLTLGATEAFPLLLSASQSSRPILGTTWSLNLSNVPLAGAFGVDVLGLSDPNIGDLLALGMPGCGLRASLDSLTAWFVGGPTHARSFAVPSSVTLRGVDVFATSAVFVPGFNAFGAITSNGIRGRIGDL